MPHLRLVAYRHPSGRWIATRGQWWTLAMIEREQALPVRQALAREEADRHERWACVHGDPETRT